MYILSAENLSLPNTESVEIRSKKSSNSKFCQLLKFSKIDEKKEKKREQVLKCGLL